MKLDGPRNGLDAVEKDLVLLAGIELRFLGCQSAVSSYTD
jgi:hypothetical protein